MDWCALKLNQLRCRQCCGVTTRAAAGKSPTDGVLPILDDLCLLLPRLQPTCGSKFFPTEWMVVTLMLSTIGAWQQVCWEMTKQCPHWHDLLVLLWYDCYSWDDYVPNQAKEPRAETWREDVPVCLATPVFDRIAGLSNRHLIL